MNAYCPVLVGFAQSLHYFFCGCGHSSKSNVFAEVPIPGSDTIILSFLVRLGKVFELFVDHADLSSYGFYTPPVTLGLEPEMFAECDAISNIVTPLVMISTLALD